MHWSGAPKRSSGLTQEVPTACAYTPTRREKDTPRGPPSRDVAAAIALLTWWRRERRGARTSARDDACHGPSAPRDGWRRSREPAPEPCLQLSEERRCGQRRPLGRDTGGGSSRGRGRSSRRAGRRVETGQQVAVMRPSWSRRHRLPHLVTSRELRGPRSRARDDACQGPSAPRGGGGLGHPLRCRVSLRRRRGVVGSGGHFAVREAAAHRAESWQADRDRAAGGGDAVVTTAAIA